MIDELVDGARELSAGIYRSVAGEQPKGCERCYEEDGARVEMEATTAWSSALAVYVDAWECPECGRQVMRADEGEWTDEVGLTAPDGERF